MRRKRQVECDQCGTVLIGVTPMSRRAFRRELIRFGWDLGKRNYADLCPSCVRMDHDA